MMTRQCAGAMLMLATSLATLQYFRPMAARKFGFSTIREEVLKHATPDQYKHITNVRLRRNAIDINEFNNVSHVNNHMKVVGICALGLLVAPLPFTKLLYIYTIGEAIYRINHLMFVKKGKMLFDFRKYENMVDIFMMFLQGAIAIGGVAKLLTRKKATDIVLKQ